jgi:hypothetical protein
LFEAPKSEDDFIGKNRGLRSIVEFSVVECLNVKNNENVDFFDPIFTAHPGLGDSKVGYVLG